SFERESRLKQFAPVLLIATFFVIFLAQYRTILVTLALSVILIGFVVASTSGRRGVFFGSVTILAAAGAFAYAASELPLLKLTPTVQAIRSSPASLVRTRVHALSKVVSLYNDHPSAIVIGTGPGTYSSRAWKTFAHPFSRSQSNTTG